MTTPEVTAPTFEHHPTGLGIGCPRPRLSWKFRSTPSTAQAWIQSEYELEIKFALEADATVYRVVSDQSILVPWPARSLRSREQALVRIRVRGTGVQDAPHDDHQFSSWSHTSAVETALLRRDDYQAKFITASWFPENQDSLRPIRLAKVFTPPDDVRSDTLRHARLYVTALGVFEVWINGQRVGDECLAPGWTSYKHRLTYRTHDVSDMLRPGENNMIVIEVAEGWYAGRLGFAPGKRFLYGKKLAAFAQLEISHKAAVRPWVLCSDESWHGSLSALTAAGIYDGERYDMNQDPSVDDEHHLSYRTAQTFEVVVHPWPAATLVAPDSPPIRVTETLSCKRAFRSPSGKLLLDFGQNLVGKLFIPRLQTCKGEELQFRHAEVLEDGELGLRPLKDAKACDVIVGSGRMLSNWSPRFTYHGFRFVEVTGWSSDGPPAEIIQALVLHTDMYRRGYFECSNETVNQLHKNVVWSMRGNFFSIPTDCPQRDERLGWTGDIQVFCPTANFLYDTTSMLAGWLQDLAEEQLEPGKSGIPPLVVPYALDGWPHLAQAIWGDVTVLTPNCLFQYTSDKALLERQFSSMSAWLEHGVDRDADGLWKSDNWQLADWLDPSAPPEDPGNGRTDSNLVANAYLVYTTEIFSRVCQTLGKVELAAKYAEQTTILKKVFQQRYITPTGNLMSNSQCAIALAIQFGLYPCSPGQRQTAAKALERLVRIARFNISTGFAGTPVIAHALTRIGKPQLAYRMLLETTCPSWLYPIVYHSATTIWERWDSILVDGRINPGSMTSFNHYALGAVADWLHTSVGGISPGSPGWRTIRVRPVPGGNISRATASFQGPYGQVQCAWQLEGNKFSMSLTVPPNCSATVTLPSEQHEYFTDEPEKSIEVFSGTHNFACEFEAQQWPPKPIVAGYMAMPSDTIAR